MINIGLKNKMKNWVPDEYIYYLLGYLYECGFNLKMDFYCRYSPNIREIKVVSHRKVRRARLYYLRDKLPKLSTFK